MTNTMKTYFAVIAILCSPMTALADVIIDTTVFGTQSVYFAGYTLDELDAIRIAEGTYTQASYFGDITDPNTLPDAIDITGFGGAMSISASGAWSHGPDVLAGPDGALFAELSQPQYGIFGISLLDANIGMLVGVFLSDQAPIPGAAPANLSAVAGDDMTSPLLNQAFGIGAGIIDINAPDAATRLYLGLHDGYEWTNNRGSANVRIQSAAVPEPASLGLLGVGLLGLGLIRRKRKA